MRLRGACWILIRMVVLTRLIVSLCVFRRLLLFLLRNWVEFFVDYCVVVSFRCSDGLQMSLQFPKVPYRRYRPISITPVLSNVLEILKCSRFGSILERSRDLGSCYLISSLAGRIWVPVMLFWISSVVVRWNWTVVES